MSNADKYFGVFGTDSETKDGARQSDSSVDKLVDKVRRKAKNSNKNYNAKKQGAAYKSKNDKRSQDYSPSPEKVGSKKPEKKESLDDVVKKASETSKIPSNPSGINPGNNSSGTGRSEGPGSKSNQDYSKDNSGDNQPNSDRADPIKYFLGEVLKSVKEVYIPDPQDSTYKFSRRLTSTLVRDSDEFPDKVLKDGLSIGVYKLLDDLLRGAMK